MRASQPCSGLATVQMGNSVHTPMDSSPGLDFWSGVRSPTWNPKSVGVAITGATTMSLWAIDTIGECARFVTPNEASPKVNW